MKNKTKTRRLVATSVLASVAAVLMFLEFPLWFAPNFYKIDFSEIPVLIGSFAYGPVAGIAIEAVKIIIKTVIKGTSTMGVGELANFLIGISFIIPASYIYRKNKTKKTAIVGLLVGIVSMSIIAVLLNWAVLLPAYAFFMSSSEVTYTVSDFVYLGSIVNPLVTNIQTYLLFAVLPFNLIKGIITSVVVMLIYKRISIIIKAKDSEAN